MFSDDELRAALRPAPKRSPDREHAAVAMIMRRRSQLELCFIVRAERAGDRWSGQVAFPGGRPDPVDGSLRDTAERETREEVGIDLSRADWLGTLSPVPIRPAGAGGVLAPYLYRLSSAATLSLEASEVADAFLGAS